MKKVMSLCLVALMMFSLMGFTSVEKSYLEDSKKIWEWKGTEDNVVIHFSAKDPKGESLKLEIQADAKSDMKNMITFMQLNLKSVEVPKDFPAIPEKIQMYTKGADIYLDRDSFKELMKATSKKDLDIKEDFVMIKSDSPMTIDSKVMKEMMDYLYQMDLGIDSGLTKDGNKYSLTMDSDKMIDLFDAYMKYTIQNIDKFPKSFLAKTTMKPITKEEQAKALEEYNKFSEPMIKQAKEMIKGSSFSQTTTISDDKVESNSKINLKFQGGEFVVDINTTSKKSDSVVISLPTSVKTYTSTELSQLMMPEQPTVVTPEQPKIEAPVQTQPEKPAVVAQPSATVKQPVVSVQPNGKYLVPSTSEKGTLRIKMEDGKMQFNVEDLNRFFSGQIYWLEDYVSAHDLVKFGINANWNPATHAVDLTAL